MFSASGAKASQAYDKKTGFGMRQNRAMTAQLLGKLVLLFPRRIATVVDPGAIGNLAGIGNAATKEEASLGNTRQRVVLHPWTIATRDLGPSRRLQMIGVRVP